MGVRGIMIALTALLGMAASASATVESNAFFGTCDSRYLSVGRFVFSSAPRLTRATRLATRTQACRRRRSAL